MAVCAPLALACAASAEIVDNFDSYATGPLSAVSGGVWNTSGGASTDAQVVDMGLSPPNAMYHDGIGVPHVVSYSGTSVLAGAGSVATFSYDFNVYEQGDADVDTYLFVGSGNPAHWSTDYSSCVGIFIVDWADIDGVGASALHIWDVVGAPGGGDYGIIELDRNLPAQHWHHVELIATQTIPDMTANPPDDADGFFDVFIDGLSAAAGVPFGLDSPVGLNALEVYSFDDRGAQDDYHLYDNIALTPEPASLLILALAGPMLRRR